MNVHIAQFQNRVALAAENTKIVKEQEFIRVVSKKVADAFKTAEEHFRPTPSYTTTYDPSEEVDFLNKLGIMNVVARARVETKDYIVMFNFREDSVEPNTEYGKILYSLAISLSAKLMDHFFHPVIAGLEKGTTTFVFKYPVPDFVLGLLKSSTTRAEVKEVSGVYHLYVWIE